MKADLNYTPSNVFETFPFPKTNENTEGSLDGIGSAYHAARAALMVQIGYGLTKLYNLFHSPNTALDAATIAADGTALEEKAFEKRYGKDLHAICRHLEKAEKTASFADILRGLQDLRQQHQTMDEAVLRAYGWTDVALNHGFHDVDYLPETDRTRFTIAPAARKEVLKRLLQLNHTRRAEEETDGLWDKEMKKKGKVEKPKFKEIQAQGTLSL